MHRSRYKKAALQGEDVYISSQMERILETVLSPIGLAGLGLVATLVYMVYSKFISPFRLLSKHGIPGPTPTPFWGNFLTIKREGLLSFLDKQHKKYGPVFGFYVGSQSRIVIADPELLKQVMVKKFATLPDRGFIGGPDFFPKLFGHQKGLVAATGETWKTARHALTPAFSGMKMKMMVPLIEKSCNILVVKVGEYANSGESVELFRLYGRFTMESLVSIAFGRYVGIQNGEANQLTEAASDIFQSQQESNDYSPDQLLLLLSNFPWLEPLLLRIIRKEHFSQSVFLLHKTALTLVQERMKSQQSPKVKDLLQLMVDACTEEGSTNGKKKLTEEEIVAFSIDFLLAGYETTANTLSFTSYLLALNPEVQEKLQAEIDNYFEENPEMSLYEATQDIQYLDMVLQESMRLYTPAPRTLRYCTSTVQIGDVTIPKGAQVVVPINVLHHSPEYWPDPYKFDPERFTAEEKAKRPQLAHMPFGWGPRNCIGMRFALLEAKIALIGILRKYSFVRGPETEEDLEVSTGITLSPKNGVFVKVIARE